MTAQITEQEIAREQAYVDRVYERLQAATATAQELAKEGHGRARLGHQGGLVERDAMVHEATRRIAALDAAREGLVFGRLDLRDGGTRYVGRIGLRDAEREPLLMDWRAPAASVFYRATPQDPLGVVRRRVLRCVGEKVVGVEDDLLDAGAAPADMVVVGDGALLAELTRARDRRMHSVVATIQREQDLAIRAPERGVTTISGGPGTGKTVVALHRAAYLLYANRRRFETGGVLVVGPSSVFMSYIDRVLPSLGETSVTLRSIGEVVPGVVADRHDPAAIAAVKGSARMRQLLARAAHDPAPDAPSDLRVFYRDDVLRLDRRALTALRRRLLTRGQRHNAVRPRVAPTLIDALWERVHGERARARGKEHFADHLLGSPDFTGFVDAWWPVLDPFEVFGWLTDRFRLLRYADGLLAVEEVDLLLESWAGEQLEPSIEDVPLIDELGHALGERPVEHQAYDPLAELVDASVPEVTTLAERVARRRSPTHPVEDEGYAHVLVDEAQDLSPMQWRMIGRRGRRASWTVVGDPAQSSWPYPDEAAAARIEALRGLPEQGFRLTTNYRNAKEIFDLAAVVGRAAIRDLDLPVAVRTTGEQPRQIVVEASELGAATRTAVAESAEAVDGTLAVVAPSSRLSQVPDWLSGYDPGRLSVLAALDSKGLEFDAVVVITPEEIAAESPTGLRTLYVVLTRATRRLTTVGTDPHWLPRAQP